MKYRFMVIAMALSMALFFLPAAPAVFAQDAKVKVSGTVLDTTGEPLVGVGVVIKGTKTGVFTDIDGKFTITADANAVLEVSSMGFVTENVNVNGKSSITVRLKSDSTMLDDVVVIGYGSVKKQDLTGSVTNVQMNDIKSAPAQSVDNALQGRIAGADIMSTSGEPGATTTIRIRGSRSITASNEPLIVVDGIIDAIHDLNDINAEDIASLSVLKDASSTAIYGSRGSNGVIIITTKAGMGSKGKPNISFKADMGFSQLPGGLDIMNAAEFAIYRNDLASFGADQYHPGLSISTPMEGNVYRDPLSMTGTDWIKEITRTALYQNYSLSLTGKTEGGSYYSSFSYNDSEGIIKDSGQKRFTGRIKLDRQLFKWMKVGYNGSYTWRHNDETKSSIGGTSWWGAAQYLSPMLKPSDIENTLYNGGQKYNNPIAVINLNTHYLERHSMNHAFSAEITPVKNLTVKSILSYYLYQRHTYRYYSGQLPAKAEDQGGDAYRAEYDENSISNETTASYSLKTKSGHSLTPMVGFSAYRYASHNFTLSGSGYMDDAVLWNNMTAVQDKQTYSAGTSFSKKTKMSTFARLDYNFKSRYYITATGRYDGASNFAANSKWAFFPSTALRWNVANEPFMKNVSWVDDLALRASYGITGNDAISSYQSLAAINMITSGYLFDGSQPAAAYRSRLASPDLTWEKTALANLALDASLFKGRLNLTAEVYTSKTTDLLLSVQQPTQTGYSSRLTNIGKTSNKGIELSIESMNIANKNFQWSTNFTISHNSQKVEDIGSEDFVTAYSSPGNNPYMMYGYVKGYPLNSLWGFKYGGTWKSSDEIERNKVTKTYANPSNVVGGARYYDIDHNGTLDQKDLVYQGNADPYLYGGLQNNFYWKGLRLGVYFTYSLGGKLYNFSEFFMAGSTFTNQYRYMLYSWNPILNPEADIQRCGAKT